MHDAMRVKCRDSGDGAGGEGMKAHGEEGLRNRIEMSGDPSEFRGAGSG